MHAVVVVTSVGAETDPEYPILRGQIIPAVQQLPGFVNGIWLAPVDGRAEATVVFESEAAVRAAVEAMGVRPGASLIPDTEVLSVEFHEVAGHA